MHNISPMYSFCHFLFIGDTKYESLLRYNLIKKRQMVIFKSPFNWAILPLRGDSYFMSFRL